MSLTAVGWIKLHVKSEKERDEETKTKPQVTWNDIALECTRGHVFACWSHA